MSDLLPVIPIGHYMQQCKINKMHLDSYTSMNCFPVILKAFIGRNLNWFFSIYLQQKNVSSYLMCSKIKYFKLDTSRLFSHAKALVHTLSNHRYTFNYDYYSQWLQTVFNWLEDIIWKTTQLIISKWPVINSINELMKRKFNL